MKIAIYISHPAQYLFYKNPIRMWQQHGHTMKIFIRTKDVLEQLIRNDGIEYENVMPAGRKPDKINITKAFIARTTILYFKIRKFRPDILLGTDASMSHIAYLLRKPCITTLEDDYSVIKKLAVLTYPLTSTILTPTVCNVGRWKNKKIGYAGYMKLSYLHPNRFSPNQELINQLAGNVPYCLIRLSRLTAYHDMGITGMTTASVENIIQICLQSGRAVFISSEGKLLPVFEQYQLRIEASDIHHVLSGADLLISDSQSMSVEAAMLGVPSLRFSDFSGRISVLEELEHTYHLTFGINTANPEKLVQLTRELLSQHNLRAQFQQLRQAMIATKIDVAAFVTWFVENYPASLRVMQSNPEYQHHFQQVVSDSEIKKTEPPLIKTEPPLIKTETPRDFTFAKYKELLTALKEAGYEFRTFESFCKGNTQGRFIMLRHDVDSRPSNSVQFAKLELSMNIHSTYYFRIVAKSNQPDAIRNIVKMGHELGYHYENLRTTKGNIEMAIRDFSENLHYFRGFYPVCTISMHGSPTSRYDNRNLWTQYNYRTWDIIGEPYFDIDFSQMMYLTDTGHCWNGQSFNVRDKVEGSSILNFASTDDIILAAKQGLLPDKIMINTHPQRWTDNKWGWMRENYTQLLKNQIKRIVVFLQNKNNTIKPEKTGGYIAIDDE